jgi:2-polyprenyl-6-hydroxyphenyl methylase/3-demethylubiquinone-9 3-methyltransferase
MERRFLPLLDRIMAPAATGRQTTVLDVGCGNGALCGRFLERGYRVVGIDVSESGLAIARAAHPAARFEMLEADETILERLAEPHFDCVTCMEVIEHVYDPLSLLRGCWKAVRPGGTFVCSTPYHGYLKNLAIALLDKFDKHVEPWYVGGHIKFFSRRTLLPLMREAGFVNLQFHGVGRLPYLWMSMVVSGEKPARGDS